jgi:intraflagellar transport protein 52
MQDVVFQWLTTGDIHLNQIDAEDPEVGDCIIEMEDGSAS